jgi:hypothetical protein
MLLDTSGLMCLFDYRDSRHHVSGRSSTNSASQRVTPQLCVAEFVALAIARRAPLIHALRFIEAIPKGQRKSRRSGLIGAYMSARFDC